MEVAAAGDQEADDEGVRIGVGASLVVVGRLTSSRGLDWSSSTGGLFVDQGMVG